MTTATRTTQTENIIIEIKLTRTVSDKVAYLDGYNLPTGREVFENYEVKLTSKRNGATVSTSGKPGGFAFFATASKFQKIPAGAFARISDAYVNKDVYDLAMSMIAGLDAEVAKTDEQVALEQAAITQAAAADKELDLEAAEYARQIKNGLCPRCHSYCYGDCQS
jgi:hypothetical protein